MIGQKGMPSRGGGIERHVEELSRALVKRGHDVTLYGRGWYMRAMAEPGAAVRVMPSVHTKHLDTITASLFATLDALVRGFDVYHFHGVGPALVSFLPRLFRPSARVVVTFHCIDRFHKKWGRIARTVLRVGEWAACRFPHLTIAVSPEIAAYCWETYGRLAVIVPNGIDPGIAEEVNDTSVLSEFGLVGTDYLLVVSRLVRHKRVHDVIEAYRILVQNGTIDPTVIPLVIVGDSAFTDDYKRELAVLGRGVPGVVFAGPRTAPEVFALMRHATLSIHPSENEGMSLALMEAMACSAPVLTSDIPEHRSVVGGYGHTFRVGDVSHLASRIATLLGDSAQLRLRAELGQAMVIRTYPWSRIAERTDHLYSLICGVTTDDPASHPELVSGSRDAETSSA